MTNEILVVLGILWVLSLVFCWVYARVHTLRQDADYRSQLEHSLAEERQFHTGLWNPASVHEHKFPRMPDRTKGPWDFFDCAICGQERAELHQGKLRYLLLGRKV